MVALKVPAISVESVVALLPGAFYDVEEPTDEDSDPTFKVIAPPIGATVTELPGSAEKKTVGGKDYFVYDGTWYQPFYNGSNAVYVVVEKPA